MTTKTAVKSPEEPEWEANRDRWDRLAFGHLNKRMREWEAREAAERERAEKRPFLRRIFPWRIRIERVA
jgi:hypothetical protein